MAWDIFEETLEPFIEEVTKYQKLSMTNKSKYYCMAILLGIYKFEKESKSEYKEWTVDAPAEYFDIMLNKWKEKCNIPEDITEMEQFINTNFPGW